MGDALAISGTGFDSWQVMREKASALVKSGFLPKAIRTPEQAIAIIQTGQELGLGPMESIRGIHVIDGKPTISTQVQCGLVYKRVAGATLDIVSTTDAECTVMAGRPGKKPTQFRFTMDDAKRAGLTGKDNWRKYPRDMLRNRCLSEACRAVFPDAVMGMYTPDEMGAVTDAQGEIIVDVSPSRPASVPPPALPEQSPGSVPPPAYSETDPAAYAITFGKNAGKTVGDLSNQQLSWYADEYRGRDHALKQAARAVIDARNAKSETIAERLGDEAGENADWGLESEQGQEP